MREFIAVLLCVILVMSGFVIVDIGSIVEGKLIVDEGSMYLTSNPLKIESNAAFITSPLVSSGAGSAGDPWIIENWEIDGTGYGYCIYIGNTTDHFIIQDCYLRDAIQFWGWPFYSGNGIALYNVWNGTLQGNNITSNEGYGISLDSTSNTTIFNNSVSESGDDNIELSNSDGNIVSNNHLSISWHRGLVFSASNNNIITNNTISDHYIDGISIWGCINNTFINNTMIDDGIGIAGNNIPNWNTHEIGTTNTVNNKPVRYLKDQISGTVPSGAGQVILANCSNMVVENQNVSDGTIGICLGYSNNNCISNNTASDNFHGFNLYKSSNNTFTFNIISNNHHGIWFEESCNNTIANNSVSFNNLGFFLWVSSIGNIIVNNTISQNNGYSIEIYFWSDNNLIYHNNFIDNYYFGAYDNCTNSWDNGYPDGGNYWNEYSGTDDNNGPSQDIPGSDGIGDTPFTNIDGGNGAHDNYPLMNPIGFPFVLFTQPFSDETDVLSGTSVIAVFNKSMDTSVIPTLTQTTGIPIIYIFQGWGQTNVANDTATWTHANWAQNELITLTISNYQDLQGNFGLNHTFSFTAIDSTSPVSSVNSIDNGWKNTSPLIIEATASDGIGSGVANVTLWYRFSTYNSIWGIWKPFGTNIASPWNWNFNFPDSQGYYEFYTIAYDKKNNAEGAPASSDAHCVYDAAKPKITENNPTSGTTGDYYQLQADVTDNLGLSTVHLIYQYGNGTMVNTTMTNITATNYEFELTISPSNLNVLHYRITAVDKAGNWNTTVVRDVTIQDNDNPMANAGSNQTVNEGMTVTFSGSGSTDNVGITNYTWTFYSGQGNISFYGVSPSHNFTVAGNYTVTLKVRDAAGNLDADTMLVVVNPVDKQTTDTDGDGVEDGQDAFPNDPNEDTDTDNDGTGDNADEFPSNSNETIDTDDDGIGNNADPDDDGDGVPDADDLDPLDSNITGESGLGDYWWIILIIIVVLVVVVIFGLKMVKGKKIETPEQKEPVDEPSNESPGKKGDTGA